MTVGSMANSQMSTSMLRMSTAQKINSAADDAAGLAISEKMTSQIAGLSKNANNVADTSNLLNTAEGSLSSIGDSLSRMKELSVQASNGVLSDSDKSIIQNEINALKEGISDVVKNTEFNTMKLLDGSYANKTVASNPNGSGSKIAIENTSLETLGIKDFDVTGDFDISKIDSAIKMVTGSRAKIGATTNGLSHTGANISNRLVNETASRSRIQDTDFAEEISKFKQNQVKDAYAMQLQSMKLDNDMQRTGSLFNQLL